MTEKLYYIDSHLYEFDAVVEDIIYENEKCLIVLDKTAFFPEGGGQPSDTGKLNGTDVLYVYEKNDLIYHQLKQKADFNIGDSVTGKLDKELRFARMQAHSGEHIVSGVAHTLFGVDNVGFHMDELLMTVDFNKPLSKEDLELIENEANRYVFSNLRVNAEIFDNDKLSELDFRSKIDFPGPARIVDIEGVDKCACCAPHVNYTGEIGIIKILGAISHRGGVRLTMICGLAALRDYQSKHRQTLNIAAALCAKHSETDIAVERIIESNKDLKYKIGNEKMRYLNYIASGISANSVIFEIFSDLSMEELRELANLIKDQGEYAVILLSGTDDKGYSYCILSEKLELRKLVSDFNSALNGSGGGKGCIAQGKLNCCRNSIEKYINELKVDVYENA